MKKSAKQKNIFVSVIVPVFNSEKTLSMCIESILIQDHSNFELIFVDNNSTDKSSIIIKSASEKDSRIISLFERKIGRGNARSLGESHSKGQVVLMTDSDCIVPKNWISSMIKPIICQECSVVQGFETIAINGFWNEQTLAMMKRKISSIYDKEGFLINVLGNIDTKNFAIDRTVLEDIGNTDRKYFSGNDTDLSIKLYRNRKKVKFLQEIKVLHYYPVKVLGIIKKHIYRAKWCVIISHDNKRFLKNTSFLDDTNQTFWSFFKFFPGIVISVFRNSPSHTLYNLITGMSWRIGLVYGMIFVNFRR